MVKVLFVCLGNICRSPMAHGLFQHKIREAGLSEEIAADSAGTSSYHLGASPDQRALEVLGNAGIALKHQARQFLPQDFEEFDYILAMDSQNYKDIKAQRSGEPRAKLFMMRQFDKPAGSFDVADPYFGGMENFTAIWEQLNTSTSNLLEFICQEHQLAP